MPWTQLKAPTLRHKGGETLHPHIFTNVPFIVDHDNPLWLYELPTWELYIPLTHYLLDTDYAPSMPLFDQMTALWNFLVRECRMNNGFELIVRDSPRLPIRLIDAKDALRLPTEIEFKVEESHHRPLSQESADEMRGTMRDSVIYMPVMVGREARRLGYKFVGEYPDAVGPRMAKTFYWLKLYDLVGGRD